MGPLRDSTGERRSNSVSTESPIRWDAAPRPSTIRIVGQSAIRASRPQSQASWTLDSSRLPRTAYGV